MSSYGVADVARQLGVSKTSVIRWSSVFAAHLSPQASPEPGQPRVFTEADIATLRRAQRRLSQPGATFESVNERLAIVEPDDLAEPAEPEEAPAYHEAPTAGPEEAEQERAQSNTASQALAILSQQSQVIEAQRAQLVAQQSQLTDQAARLREAASQIAGQQDQLTGQAATMADLRERLARLEEAQRAQLEAQRQQERRRFRWPWEPREE